MNPNDFNIKQVDDNGDVVEPMFPEIRNAQPSPNSKDMRNNKYRYPSPR